MSNHQHIWLSAENGYHENDDRIRIIERCGHCGAIRHGCLAKRLDDQGQMAWGPVGEWTFKIEDNPVVA